MVLSALLSGEVQRSFMLYAEISTEKGNKT